MRYTIKNRWSGATIYETEAESLASAVTKARECSANLRSADLSGANLRSANLRSADLSGANLRSADLSGANLRSADLSGANLRSADLSGADLYSADLSGANLSGANLRSADLSGANLRSADLSGADLSGADLRSADLSGANLEALNLARLSITPEFGTPFVGWKKCRDNIIVKLAIPSKSQRSNSTGRKCRAEYVKVLQVFGAEVGISQHDEKTEYHVGQIVRCDKWDTERFNECSGGIHFFITRIEAENYS